jgi:hypothetical protein
MKATDSGRQVLLTVIFMLIMAVVSVPGPGRAWAEPGFETPPVLDASYFVAPWALKGPRYRVEDKVPTDGFQARFIISSNFGKFEALGADLLATRIAEVVAIEKLESVSKAETFVKAAAGTVARPVQAARTMLLSPVDTASGLPAGVARLFERVKLGGQRVAEGATDSSKSVGDTAGAVGQISASVLGWEQERRRLVQIHADGVGPSDLGRAPAGPRSHFHSRRSPAGSPPCSTGSVWRVTRLVGQQARSQRARGGEANPSRRPPHQGVMHEPIA